MKRSLFTLPALVLMLAWSPGFAKAASAPSTTSGTSGTSMASAAGTYVNQQNSKEYLTLRADGSFTLKQQKKPYDIEHPYMSIEGSFKLQGDKVILQLKEGAEAEGKIQDNVFVDAEGKPWMKQNAPPPKKEEDSRPSRRRTLW